MPPARILGLLVTAGTLAAQEPTASRPVSTPPPRDTISAEDAARADSIAAAAAEAARHTRCWRARPMPDCRMVFLTDIGLEMPIYSTKTSSLNPIFSKSFASRLNWSIGLMRNGARHSHGVSVSLTSENTSQLPQIVEYRYRNWRSAREAFDAAIGWKRNEVWEGARFVEADGMTFVVGYTPTRWIGASVRYDFVNALGRTHRGVMFGIQSTRVSEYTFRFISLAIVDGLLGKIGIERDSGEEEQDRSD